MNRPNDQEGSRRVEQAVTELYAAFGPDAAAVAHMEQRLLVQARLVGPENGSQERIWVGFPAGLRSPWTLPRPRWAFAVLVAVVAAALAIAAIGPQRVWADIQRLLGYVPGIGFTNLEQTLVLEIPVVVTRQGVTVSVEQAIAGRQQTQIVLRSEGLPPNKASGGITGGGGDTDIGMVLRLPDGRTLRPDEWAFRYGGATLQFPALPAGVTQATLEVAHLPLVPAGSAPENWNLPLSLQPATGQVVAARFTQPYRPADASDTHAWITLRVLEVAHSAGETAVRVQVAWADPQAKIWYLMGGRTLPVLRDDLGHAYQRQMSSSTGARAGTLVQALPAGATLVPTETGGTLDEVLAFQPISKQARRLTLEVDGIVVEVPAEGQFTLDLGEHPAIGDSWPLDVDLHIAGFPVHLTGARLVEEELPLRDGVIKRTNLEFDVDPVADQDGRSLRGFTFNAGSPAFNGSGGGYSVDTNRIRVSVQVQEGASVPPGPLIVTATRASMVESGPWRLSWEVPGR